MRDSNVRLGLPCIDDAVVQIGANAEVDRILHVHSQFFCVRVCMVSKRCPSRRQVVHASLFRTRSTKPIIISTAMITMSKTFSIGNDLEINRLGFGAMRLTGKGIWGEPNDPEEARRVLKRAVELGVNFIDTADSYGPDVSERLIGETLSPFPKGLVVATKGGLTRQGPDRWSPDGRPD